MWCVLIAAGIWHLAMCWKNSGSKLTKLFPAHECVGAGQNSCVHDLSEMLNSASNKDPLPETGDSTYNEKSNVIEVGKQVYYERDTKALNNRSLVFTYSSKEAVSMEEKLSRFSSQNKGTIRSKIAQKGWANHERRFKGWPLRKIRNTASVSQEKASALSSLPHDQERNAGLQTSLNWEADNLSPIPGHSAALCPPYIEKGSSLSLQETTDPGRQRSDKESFRPEGQSDDSTLLNISTCQVSDSNRQGSPIVIPGEAVELSNMWTIAHELAPPRFRAVLENAKHELSRDPNREKSDCEGLVKQQKEREYEKENFRDSVKEPIQTFPLRISMIEDQSLNSFRNEQSTTLQDAEELEFVRLLPHHRVTQIHPETRGRASECLSEWGRAHAYQFQLQSSRTTCDPLSPPAKYSRQKHCDSNAFEERTCQIQPTSSSPLTEQLELNIKNDKFPNTCDVGVAEAFCIADLLQAEATAQGKDLGYGCSTKGYDSEDMDKHLVTKPIASQDGKPSVVPEDGTMTNGKPTHQVGRVSYSSQKRRFVNMKDWFSVRALLPLFIKKRKIADCLQSISSLGALPNLNPSVVTTSSNDVFSFSFGLGIGLMFTWSSCKDEIKTLKSLLHQAEYDQEQIYYAQTDDLPAEMFHEKGSLDQNDYNFDKRIVSNPGSPLKVERAVAHFLNSLVDALGVQGEINDDESVKSVLTEEHMQKDNTMAELEAELEAELKLMEISLTDAECIRDESMQSPIGDLDQGDFANLVSEDFPERGLPRVPSLEKNESCCARPKLDSNSRPVSPKELEHRLRLLLEERQKEQISQLQIQLQIAKQKLQSKEAELREWKDQVRRLVDLAFISTGSDDIEATLSPTTTHNSCYRDTLDICSETEDDRYLRSPKQQRENLKIPVKENSNSNCSFGSAFGWPKERLSMMDDDMALSHTVSDKELGEPMKQRNRNHFLEHMGKSCNDRSIAKNYVQYDVQVAKNADRMQFPLDTQVGRASVATIKKSEAHSSSFDGCESDSNSSCISSCSTAFCNYIDALTIRSCQQSAETPMETAAKFLPAERMESSYLEPLRHLTTSSKTGRLRRKFRKNNSKHNVS